MKSIVYSQPNCQACNTVKGILTLHGVEVEERIIDGKAWTKDQLFEVAPKARSVPQVFIDGALIGGVVDVIKFLRILP